MPLFFNAIYWDPDPDIFHLPFFNHPLKWYGLLFMGGVIAGFFLLIPLIKEKLLQTRKSDVNDLAYRYADGLMWWIVIGTIIGARLGHVFFYEWPYYQHNLMAIFKIWEGGLASHGGTISILLAAYLYTRWTKQSYPEINFLTLTDLLAIPVSFGVIFIRLGNFINQEILGTPSNQPWAVVFGHPIDGGPIIPRHPVQLYEALAYFITFLLLTSLWKYKKNLWPRGFMTGLFFICIFGSRFMLEFFKMPQASTMMDESFLQMGQILSIPFILLGVGLVIFSQRRDSHDFSKG